MRRFQETRRQLSALAGFTLVVALAAPAAAQTPAAPPTDSNLGGGTSLATTYMAITSPNNSYTTVKAIGFFY